MQLGQWQRSRQAHKRRRNKPQHDVSTHLWLGRLTGLGAVTFPKDTMRRPGL